MIEGLTDLLTGLRNPRSDTRQKLRDDLSGFLQDLTQSPEQREAY